MRRRWGIAAGLLCLAAGLALVLSALSGPHPVVDVLPAVSDPTPPAAPALAGALLTPPPPPPGHGPRIPAPTEPVSSATGEGVVLAVVLDADGSPRAGVVVYASPSDERFEGTWPTPRRTDPKGRVRWDGVACPRLLLFTETPQDRYAAPVTATTGGTAAELRWTVRPALRIVVRDEAGQAFPGAGVAFETSEWLALTSGRRWRGWFEPTTRDEPGYYAARTDGDGVARLFVRPGLSTGRLTVSPPRDDRDFAPHVVWDWVPADADVVLHRAREISGTLRDSAGALRTEGTVRWHRGDERWESARVEYDGTWEITRLEPGHVVLEPQLPGVPVRPGTGRRLVAAGTTDVVLVADVGRPFLVRIASWPREPGGYARLTRETDGPEPRTIQVEVSIEGEALFPYVEAEATYTLWVPRFPVRAAWEEPVPPQIVYRTGIAPGAEPLVVERAPGREARGRLVVPGLTLPTPGLALWGSVNVVTRGVAAEAMLSRDGTFAFADLPEGSWEVRVEASTQQGDAMAETWEGTGRVATNGEPTTIPLRAAAQSPEDR